MSTRRTTIFRGLQILVVVSLVVVSAVAWRLYRHTRLYYQELHATKLDPLGTLRFQVPRPVEDLQLLFYGDSRAAQWPAPASLVGRTMNFGIGGQTTEQILGRFDQYLAALKPRIVLVEAGVNDLKTIPLFPDREAAIIARCEANLRQIVERSRQLGAHVVITTVFPVGNYSLERSLVWSDRVPLAIQRVNEFIRSLESGGVTVFDADKVLADQSGKLRPEFSADLLHLSPTGYAALNQGLERLLETMPRTK